jgi:hypothetical protein
MRIARPDEIDKKFIAMIQGEKTDEAEEETESKKNRKSQKLMTREADGRDER